MSDAIAIVQMVAIPLGGFVTLLVSLTGFLFNVANRRRTQQQRSLQFFESWIAAEEVLARAHVLLAELNQSSKDEDMITLRKSEEWFKVLVLLNKLEALAVGLHHRVYNKRMIMEFFGTAIPLYFEQTKPLIKYLRKMSKDSTIFENFERLAKEMESQKSKEN